MKKKILVIAPKSYPVIDAEAIVNIKLLTALSNSNQFEIDLISKRGGQYYPSDSLESYNVKINKHEIIQVENKINLSTIFQHIVSYLVFGCTFMGAHWAVVALPCVKRLVKSNKYDYVLTKNSPSFLLGWYLKKRYGIKWIATWNDPCPDVKYPQPYGEGYSAKGKLVDRLQISIMKKADGHIFPSKRLQDYMMKYLNVSKEQTYVIPHVILNSDKSEYICSEEKTLKIIHSGNLKAPRNPRPFLEALSEFHHLNQDKQIEVTLMGVYDSDIPDYIRKFHIEDVVKLERPVAYQESIKVLSNYHVCLIIEADCEEGIFLPTKVADFLQCGKRIYALSPKIGVLHDLFESGAVSYFSYVEDKRQILESLNMVYNDFQKGLLNSFMDSTPPEFTEENISKLYFSL